MPTTVLLCTTWTLLLLYLSNTPQAGTSSPPPPSIPLSIKGRGTWFRSFHCNGSFQAQAPMLVCIRGTTSYHWILQHNPWSLSQSSPGDLLFLSLNDNITFSLETYRDGPSTVRGSSRLSELCATTTWRWKYFAGRTGSSRPAPRPYLSEQRKEKKELAWAWN